MKKVINSPKAPKAIGPYSQAIEVNGTLYISGQLPVDVNTGKFVEGGIKEQTEQSLKNIGYILEAAGYTYENIIAREGWNPKQYMQTPGTTMATLEGTTLSWNAIDGAAGYLIFVNGVYLAQTTETSVSVTTAADGVYTVRGVGHYGSISAE